jgi:hypothetical protein
VATWGTYPFDLGSQSDHQFAMGTFIVRPELESLGAFRPGYGDGGWKNLAEEAFGSIFTSTLTWWMHHDDARQHVQAGNFHQGAVNMSEYILCDNNWVSLASQITTTLCFQSNTRAELTIPFASSF